MKWSLLAVLVICALGLAMVAAVKMPVMKVPDFSDHKPCAVLAVVDGDTVEVEVDGKRTRMRLIGVNAPEVDEYYNKEATMFLTNLLKGEQAYVICDLLQGEADGHGRALAYLYRVPDGLFVNAEIVLQGYGVAFKGFRFEKLREFEQLEQFAQEAGKGLWTPKARQEATLPIPVPSTKKLEPKTEADEAGATVYVTRTGSKYHGKGCRHVKETWIPMTVSAAKQAGYTPCGVCRPAQ